MNEENTLKQIEQWANIYKDCLINESFAKKMTPEDLVRKIQEEASPKAEVKIVLNGKFYDIKDIYTVDEDDYNRDYICIEALTK